MSANIVKYKNELNTIPLRNFKNNEVDIFFGICSKMRERDLETISLSFDELKSIVNYPSRSIERFMDDIESMYDKMIQLTYRQVDQEGNRKKFILFTDFEISKTNQIAKIGVNPKFKYILNSLEKEFTRFELEEFTRLRSNYSKAIYRLLKQFRTTGYYEEKIDIFRELLDIPKSYTTSDIDKRVLKPAIKELQYIFKNLNFKKIRNPKRKNKIEKIIVSFDKETINRHIYSEQKESKAKQSKQNNKKSPSRLQSIEKTPQWLLDRDKKQEKKEVMSEEERKKFEEDKRILKEQIESFWKN